MTKSTNSILSRHLSESRLLASSPPGISASDEAEFIREAFELVATGNYMQDEIRFKLRMKGFECSKSSFSRIFSNRTYIGKVWVSGEGQPDYYVDGRHEAIVSEAVFFQVQDVLFWKEASKHN
ncbi:recombinase family protein [Fulvivirgaceae bacterium PWU4]|uniref:Recombinase family protein n=1 Tax=Chryseosolibacter histidini TaxID=2782349 RepID=A0AAP2GQ60_9BACT|nr:recombinase family protein [Chryseosolibacter histidini]MBT1698167.1 recombinase family protein [Chryseosolibacter histidini]